MRKNLTVAIISLIFCFCLTAGPVFAGGEGGPIGAGAEANVDVDTNAIAVSNPVAQGVGNVELKNSTEFKQTFEGSRPIAIHPNPIQAPSTPLGIGYSGEQRIGPNVCKWAPYKYKKFISSKDIKRIKDLRKLKGKAEAFPWNDFPGSTSFFEVVEVPVKTIDEIAAKYDIIGPIVAYAEEERWVFCDDLYARIADLNLEKIGASIIIPLDEGFTWGSTTEAGQKSIGAFLSGLMGLAGKVALGATGGIAAGSMDVNSHTYPFAVALAVKPKQEPTAVAPPASSKADAVSVVAIAPFPKKDSIANGGNGKKVPMWGDSGYISPVMKSISPDR